MMENNEWTQKRNVCQDHHEQQLPQFKGGGGLMVVPSWRQDIYHHNKTNTHKPLDPKPR